LLVTEADWARVARKKKELEQAVVAGLKETAAAEARLAKLQRSLSKIRKQRHAMYVRELQNIEELKQNEQRGSQKSIPPNNPFRHELNGILTPSAFVFDPEQSFDFHTPQWPPENPPDF
jgi:hypothetical protein